jgi:hypothetical protein
MSTITLKTDVTVAFPGIEITGDLLTDETRSILELIGRDDEEWPESEVLNVSLEAYGLYPEPGCIFIKDWSEHGGVTDSLVAIGAVEIVRALAAGPFNSRAYEVRILGAAS